MNNRQRREGTCEGLLQAAAHLFAGKGYDATGVAEICRKAGVSKGAFYYHFQSKQALFLTLIEQWLHDLEASLHAADAELRSPTEWLIETSRTFQGILDSQSRQVALILEFWTQACRDDAVREAVLTTFRGFQRFFQAIIERGILVGEFSAVDPVAGAQVLLSLASGLFFQGLLDPRGPDWAGVAETSMKIALEGLGGNL